MTDEQIAKLQEMLTEAVTRANTLVCVRDVPKDANGRFDPTKIDPKVYERAKLISGLFAENQRALRMIRAILKGAIETMGYDPSLSGDPTTVYVCDEKTLWSLLTASLHTGLEIGWHFRDVGAQLND